MTKICVDAGHGGRDNGSSLGNRFEKNDNLNIALKVRDILEGLGYTVIMTREDDSYPTLPERVEKANSEGCDVYISLHRNAFNGKTRGIETLISTLAGEVSVILAKNIQQRLVLIGGINRGVKRQQDNVYVLDKTVMPAVTVELLFVDNPRDNELFDEYIDEYALAIADGILETVPPNQTWEAYRQMYLTEPMMRGNDVANLQRQLKSRGFFSGGISGLYGNATARAVYNFQKQKGLTPDGIAGKDTVLLLGGKWMRR